MAKISGYAQDMEEAFTEGYATGANNLIRAMTEQELRRWTGKVHKEIIYTGHAFIPGMGVEREKVIYELLLREATFRGYAWVEKYKVN